MTTPTLPTRSLLQDAEYVPSVKSDIRLLFARIRSEQEAAKRAQPNPNVKQIRRTK